MTLTTSKIRKTLKAIDAEISVSALGPDAWLVKTNYHLDQTRKAIAELGLEETDKDVEGSRWDCRHVLTVEPVDPKFLPVKITIVQGTPEWDALCEALGQYTENTGCYVEDLEPGEDPAAEKHLKAAEGLMEQVNAAHARLAEI